MVAATNVHLRVDVYNQPFHSQMRDFEQSHRIVTSIVPSMSENQVRFELGVQACWEMLIKGALNTFDQHSLSETYVNKLMNEHFQKRHKEDIDCPLHVIMFESGYNSVLRYLDAYVQQLGRA